MDRRQKKLERRKKHREKVRKEHLHHQKNERDQAVLEKVLDMRCGYLELPNRDDRLGWARHNQLELKKVILAALKQNPDNKALRRFLFKPLDTRKDDCGDLQIVFTKAAQSISCDPPFFVPYVDCMMNEGNLYAEQRNISFKKHSTSYGAVWTPGLIEYVVYHHKKAYQLAFSTHAMERFVERFGFEKKYEDMKLFRYIVRYMEPTDLIGGLVPMRLIGSSIFGYMPFETHEKMIVGTTFLLPGMRGTPEHQVLLNNGFNVNVTIASDYEKPEILKAFRTCCQENLFIKLEPVEA